MPTLERAIAIAAEAHAGQVDKAGDLDLPPCTECGACCIEAGPVTVEFGSETDRRVPRYLTRSVRNTMGYMHDEGDFGVRQMAKHIGGRCKALKGEAMKDCRCVIYERRPAVCADFPRGSEQCLFSRRMAEHKVRHLDRRYRGYGPNWHETV